MKNNPANFSDLEIERIKDFIALSPREKLNYLEQLNQFLNRVMPEENKKIWEQLKEQGF